MDKLTEIMQHKRHEIAPLLRPVFIDELLELDATLPRPPAFLQALRRPDGQLAVIAEIKRRSPSAGVISANTGALEQARRACWTWIGCTMKSLRKQGRAGRFSAKSFVTLAKSARVPPKYFSSVRMERALAPAAR